MKKTRNLRLRQLINSIDIEQQELAKMIGAAPASITRWLKGEPQPSKSSCQRIANATGCSLKWLRDGEGEMFPGQKTSYSNIQDSTVNLQDQNANFQIGSSRGSCNRCNDLSDEILEFARLASQCESLRDIRNKIVEYKDELTTGRP